MTTLAPPVLAGSALPALFGVWHLLLSAVLALVLALVHQGR